jgi:hypothetical protein
MKTLSALLSACFALAACGGTTPVQPAIAAPSLAKATQPADACANADAVLGTLITLVQHATHVQAPATEAQLLPLLRAAHVALVAKPCGKEAAKAAMRAFNVAVDANASSLSAAQVTMFHSLANRVINTIK